MFAITSGLAKKLYDNYRRKQMRAPFPTSRHPPKRRAGRSNDGGQKSGRL